MKRILRHLELERMLPGSTLEVLKELQLRKLAKRKALGVPLKLRLRKVLGMPLQEVRRSLGEWYGPLIGGKPSIT